MTKEAIVTYRELAVEDICRIGEVNREELIEAEYVAEPDGSGFGIVTSLRHFDPPKFNPAWGREGTDNRIKAWKPHLERGGFLYGAFSSERLIGFIILSSKRRDCSGEIVALFVDRDFRKQGIATQLMTWAEMKASDNGIEALFLYSNPTVSSASFYLNMGFQISGLIAKQIVRDLSGDIVMAKELS